MIILNKSYKYNLLYKNYINQFSDSYIKGSPLYVSESYNDLGFKEMYIHNFINLYKSKFIKLYINNNTINQIIKDEGVCNLCFDTINKNYSTCLYCKSKYHNDCIEKQENMKYRKFFLRNYMCLFCYSAFLNYCNLNKKIFMLYFFGLCAILYII